MTARETWVYDPAVKQVVPKTEYLARERPSRNMTYASPKKVTRGSWILDPVTLKLIPKHLYQGPGRSGLQIVRDIESYRPVAADKHTGLRPVIGGRRQHREFLKRNGYIELGNEKLKNNTQLGPRPGEVAREIKRALGE